MSRVTAARMLAAGVMLAACGDDALVGRDAGRPVDGSFEDGAAPTDAAPAGDATAEDAGWDAAPTVDAGSGCAPGVSGCTCVTEPREPDRACTHSFGGLYSHGACSGSYQCCDGSWQSGHGSCGACTCVETTGTTGCVPDGDGDRACFPEFDGAAGPLPAEVRELMTGVSWREGCPVGLDALSLLDLPHWGFDGAIHRGELVVATSVASDVLETFRRIYDARFPIDKIRLVDHYDADDDRSMEDNNTSAFNCRRITGGTSWSQHSYGNAIDINPVQNPYVSGGTVLPPAGSAYVDRSDVRPGMIVDPGPVVSAFDAIGWGWGGDWSSLKDYQHFSENGR